MEQDLIKVLKALLFTVSHSEAVTAEELIDEFCEKAHLALTPSGRKDLIDFVNNEIFKENTY